MRSFKGPYLAFKVLSGCIKFYTCSLLHLSFCCGHHNYHHNHLLDVPLRRGILIWRGGGSNSRTQPEGMRLHSQNCGPPPRPSCFDLSAKKRKTQGLLPAPKYLEVLKTALFPACPASSYLLSSSVGP